MKIKIPYNVKIILDRLDTYCYKAYIVGGCVRDSILGKVPHDWDICTNATPDEVMKIFKDYKIIPIGLKHGTVAINIDGENYEITTFRTDGDYTNGRQPDNVKFTIDLEEDLKRRDFTINAIAYNEREGFIDFFNGINHIFNEIICCVGKPNERFSEDGLRILRAIRFASQLNFTIEHYTLTEIKTNKQMIEKISKERIREEFNKILLSNKPSNGIRLLDELGLLEYIVPELIKCVSFDQCNHNHNKDVFNHILEVLDNVESKLEVRLACLFHDIGKPITFSIGEDGEGHFFNHHKESATICKKVMKNLRYSNSEINYVSTLVLLHMTRYQELRPKTIKKFINKVGIDKLDDLFKVFIADRKGSKHSNDIEDIEELRLACEKVINEEQPLDISNLEVNGYDLMEIGIPQGKYIGIILKYLLEEVLDNEKLNIKEILLEMSKNYYNKLE